MCHNSTEPDSGGSERVNVLVRGSQALQPGGRLVRGLWYSATMVATRDYAPTLWDVSAALELLTTAMAEYRAMDLRQRAILSTLVAELRSAGVTWEEIGKAAGISHQAAHKRWSKGPFPVPPPPELVDLDDDDGSDDGEAFGE